MWRSRIQASKRHRIQAPQQRSEVFVTQKIVTKFSETWYGMFLPDPGVGKPLDLGSATLICSVISRSRLVGRNQNQTQVCNWVQHSKIFVQKFKKNVLLLLRIRISSTSEITLTASFCFKTCWPSPDPYLDAESRCASNDTVEYGSSPDTELCHWC